ncbi:MAG: DUF2130 domain-containing protein [Candidatus Omnitrophica bacterium]|nr:DUF2130 domain-containing protein [Candidatus Omnitrophota bacterium]
MNNQIKCPNCGHSFDVEEALSGKMEAHFKAEYEKKVAEQADKFNQEKNKLDAERRLFAQKQAEQAELFEAELAKQLKQEKAKIESKALESVEQEMKSLQQENDKRKAENKALKEKEVQLLKQEAALKEKQEDLQLSMEKQMLERQKEIEDKARAKERESFELEKVKLVKQLDDQKKLTEEMKRKQEQGSMQMQGEVQELALEDLLSRTYPFDKISEVPKGVRGADSIQLVVNALQQDCGSIVYESKRTKSFANDWIDKLKQDQIICKADIAVLVTESLPSDMDRFGEKNGVWICGFNEVKSLSFVLREMLIKTHSVKLAQVNKGDKMELLYNYLTSNEFVQNIKRIVENYDEMINQLNSEKKAMQKIWAIREKQIWVVQENISSLFGSIKGIAGNALDTSSVLQLPDATIDA